MRRTWMLLLVTVLLTVFLAVPAMAADCCDGGHCATCAGETPHGGWTGELSADTEFVDGGKYYVPEGGLEANLTVTGDITVTICLNGSTLTGRMEVTSKATVNIVDCSDGGKMQGLTDSTKADGGTLYISGGVVNLYNGTITGGKATTRGGNVYITEDTAQFNMYGGVVSNGAVGTTDVTTMKGGNVYVAGGAFNLVAGEVTGGQAARGGNIYVSKGTLTLGKNEPESDERNNSVKITDGWAVKDHGGNLFTDLNTTVRMYYGTISGGKACKQGGNVRTDSTFYMYGGVIFGGRNGVTSETPDGNANAANANIWVENGTATISGGWIKGRVATYSKGKAITVTGDAKIYDADANGKVTQGITLQAATDGLLVGPLSENAKVGIKMTVNSTKNTSGLLIEAPADGSGLATLAQCDSYIRNGQLVAFGDNQLTWEAKTDDAVEGIYYLRPTSEMWHCICGANAGEDHIGDCDKFDVSWTKITSNSELKTSGYYYLDLSDATAAGQDSAGTSVYNFGWNTGLASTTTSQDVYLDLNGYSLEAAVGSRFLQFYNGSRTAAHTVTITDASWGHTGRIGTYGAFTGREFTSTANSQGRLFWLSMSITKTGSSYGDTLNVYRTTLDASSLPLATGTWVGSIACVTGKSNANFYECDMTGGNVAKPASGVRIGAGIQAGGTALVTITGGTLVAGQGHQGAGVGTSGGGTVVIDDVDITGGTATAGGAIHNYNGNITVKNSTITGGTGGAVNNYSGSLTLINTTVTDATGGGVLVGTNSGTVTLGGSTTITGNAGGNLSLASGKKITLSTTDPLTAKAKVGITCADAAADRALSGAITDSSVLTGLFSDDAAYKLTLKDNNILYLVSANSANTGAVVNNGGIVLSLPKAVAMASDNDFVRLLSDYEGTITVDHSVNLDLNGKKITPDEGKSAIVLTAGDLKLADSANQDYEDKGNSVKIEVTNSGKVERAFITGTFTNYGPNHRYLVLKDAEGNYSSHRIYLAVKSTVLYPGRAAMNFRTVLRCDDTVASYLNGDGGEYGITAKVDIEKSADYNETVSPFDGSEENSCIGSVINMLSVGQSLQTQEERAEAALTGKAYILLNDSFYAEGKEIKVTSSQVRNTIKDMVLKAESADDLTLSQQIALGTMYRNYPALLDSWQLSNIPSYVNKLENVEYYCLCGNPESTGNPCAASGHNRVAWSPLPDSYEGGKITTAGNYYLTGDLELTAQMNIPAGKMVCIDTRGYDISIADGKTARGALVEGVLNLTNSTYHEDSTKMSTFTGVSDTTGQNGGTVLINKGNMSLYDGVTISCEPHASSALNQGTISVYLGSLNIYGGVVNGVSGNQKGGAISSNGSVFINKGTVNGGTDNENGGAIRVYGADAKVTIRDNAVINGGSATNGGLLYMENGTVTIYNNTLAGGSATNGGAVYVKNGTLNLNGTVTGDTYNTVLSGGTATGNGGVVYMESGTLNLNGAKLVGGNAANGGAVYVAGGNVYLSSSALVDGGTASLGGAVYVKDGSFNMNSSTVQNGHATRANSSGGCGANFYVESGSLNIQNGSTVQGGTYEYENKDGYGGTVLYAKGGTIEVKDSKLYGNTSTSTAKSKHGGTIFNNGGEITIENTEITASAVSNNASVLLNQAGTFTMKGSSKLDASAMGKITYGGAVVNNATFTMKDGQIIGCATGYKDHGGGAVYQNGGTFTMDDGTIYGGSTSGDQTNLGGNVRVNNGTFTMNDGSITGGSTSGTASQGGGNVAITGGTVTMNGGTISGGTSATKAGNVLVKGGTFTVNGGTISGGTAGSGNYGGSVYLESGAFNLTKGTVTGGQADRGGNVYVKAGTLTLGKNEPESDERNNSVKITDGWSKATSNGHGGNLYVEAGTVEMYYGTISGGKAYGQGGNMQMLGTFRMYGGVISDGKNGVNSATAAGNANAANSNIWVNNGTATISGGWIKGRVATYSNGKVITVTGDAKIYDADANGKVTQGITLQATTDGLLVGPLSENAKVGIKMTVNSTKNTSGLLIEAPADGSDLATLAQCDSYIRNGQLVAFGDKQLTWEAETAEAVEGIYYLRPTSEMWHCICGANAGEEHTGECTGHEVKWSAWNLSATLPNFTTDGIPDYRYLQDNDGTKDNQYALEKTDILGGTDNYGSATNDPLYIDFNGITVTTGETFNTSKQGRLLYVASDQAALNVTLLDSSEGHTGGLASGAIQESNQAQTLWLRAASDAEKQAHVVNIYRLNIDASLAENSTSAPAIRVDTGTLNLYDVNLTGGTIAREDSHGGALYVNEGCTVTINGGTVTGGNATGSGGAIYNEGTLTLNNVTVTGGNAKRGGGIYNEREATMTLNNTTIQNGKATIGGGNLFINGGTVTLDGGKLTGGVACVENGAEVNDQLRTVAGRGGAVYYADGELVLKGAPVITGNYAYRYSESSGKYNCTAAEEDKIVSNLFLSGNAVTNGGLTSGANIYISNIKAVKSGKYEGVVALSSSDCTSYFNPDDSTAVEGVTLSHGDDKIYYAIGNTDTYLVGFGESSIHPTDEDLNTGLWLGGYGNTDRTTDKLYASGLSTDLSAYYNTFGKLMANCVSITDGQGETVLLIHVDACSVGAGQLNTARALVSKATGVPVDNITISAGHQHSTPQVETVYNDDGTVKTDYATTFFNGIVTAATAACNDRQQSTVTAGILDTTNGGTVQHNFVRNVTIEVLKDTTYQTDGISYSYTKGQKFNVSPNHNGVPVALYDALKDGSLSDQFAIRYETEVDTTMQLVKFAQEDGTSIVLANFQTHPQKCAGMDNYFVHSDTIGAFRYNLKQDCGFDVIYFSGASGNVTTNGVLADNAKNPTVDIPVDTLENQMLAVKTYGESLAGLASSYLTGNSMEEVTGARDVNVTLRTVTYEFQTSDASETALANAKTLVDWETGSYTSGAHSIYDWHNMVGQYANEEDKIYSVYDAKAHWNKIQRANRGETTGELNISAYNIGGIGFITVPYEMFQESGQAIKGNVGNTYTPDNGSSNQFAYTIVASQANGAMGYISSIHGFDNGGGYSSSDNSVYARGTAETLVNNYVEMLNGMYK